MSRYPKLKTILPAHRVGTMVNNMQRAVVLQTLPPLAEGIEVTDPTDTFLLVMAGTFVVLGWFGDESGADRALWFVLALLVGGIGVPMIVTEYRFRRRRAA